MNTLKTILCIFAILGSSLAKDCIQVKNCLCADDGAHCISPRTYPKGLIGFFSFNQQSQNAELGDLTIAPIPAIGPGKGPGSFSLFSGEQSSSRITGGALKGVQKLTIMFWIFQIRKSDGFASILKKGDSLRENSPSIAISPKDGTIEVVVGTQDAEQLSVHSNGSIVPGIWTHVAVSLSEDSVSIYINGSLDKTMSVDGKIKFNQGGIWIGHANNKLGAEMFLDDLKIFNRVLSKVEVLLNHGAERIPFNASSIQLGCIDCSYKKARKICKTGTHLCSLQEILGGGYQKAYKNGWLKIHQEIWSLDLKTAKGENISSNKKVGLCCSDRDI